MQKVEIMIEGPEEKKCAEMINALANTTIKHYAVSPVNIFCGGTPVKKGFGGLQIPAFMCRQNKQEGTI